MFTNVALRTLNSIQFTSAFGTLPDGAGVPLTMLVNGVVVAPLPFSVAPVTPLPLTALLPAKEFNKLNKVMIIGEWLKA